MHSAVWPNLRILQYSNELMKKSWGFSGQFCLNDTVRQQGVHQHVRVKFSTQHVVCDVAEIHMTNCFCNSYSRFMTNEARLKINLSRMRNDLCFYMGLDQRTNNTSAASIKLSCLCFMTSWAEFKKKSSRLDLIAATISNWTCLRVSLERWKHSLSDLLMTIWFIRGHHVATHSPDAKYFILPNQVLANKKTMTTHEPTNLSASVADLLFHVHLCKLFSWRQLQG